MITTRTRHARGPVSLAAALMLALGLTLSGCGSDSDAAAGEDSAETDERDELLAFTQCLRENGMDIEDPAPGEGLRMQPQEGERGAMGSAMEACADLRPEGLGPGGGGGAASESMLEFAECMRENGVEEFPDPSGSGGMQMGPEVAEDPDFDAAREECADLIEGGGMMMGGGR